MRWLHKKLHGLTAPSSVRSEHFAGPAHRECSARRPSSLGRIGVSWQKPESTYRLADAVEYWRGANYTRERHADVVGGVVERNGVLDRASRAGNNTR